MFAVSPDESLSTTRGALMEALVSFNELSLSVWLLVSSRETVQELDSFVSSYDASALDRV